jgi:hypothetical protein
MAANANIDKEWLGETLDYISNIIWGEQSVTFY